MSRTVLVAAASGAALTLLAVLAGCDTQSARAGRSIEDGWIVTQAPAGARIGALSLDERYPAGSRIVLVTAANRAAGKPRVLSRNLVAAGGPSLTLDGEAVLFAGKPSATSRWAIYRSDLVSADPLPVLEIDGDCGDPRALPHDRLVAACTTSGNRGTSTLHTVGGDRSAPERITFGPGSALDPLPLRDGRILFSMEQGAGPGRATPGAWALFTLNPDGTMVEAFAGSHRPPAYKRRARQTTDGGVIYLASARPGGAGVERIEMSRPQAAPIEAWPGARSVEASAVEPLPDGGYLVATRWLDVKSAATSATSAIWFVGAENRSALVYDTADWDEIEAISTRAPSKPRGRPSGRQPGRRSATLICYDTARGDGEIGPAPDAVAATRSVAVETLGPNAAVVLGEVPVHDDGSFHVEVPSDVPIRVRALDATGKELTHSEWFWMRPGEVRACFGCHEDRAAAPVNRPIQALAEPPVALYAATEPRER